MIHSSKLMLLMLCMSVSLLLFITYSSPWASSDDESLLKNSIMKSLRACDWIYWINKVIYCINNNNQLSNLIKNIINWGCLLIMAFECMENIGNKWIIWFTYSFGVIGGMCEMKSYAWFLMIDLASLSSLYLLEIGGKWAYLYRFVVFIFHLD